MLERLLYELAAVGDVSLSCKCLDGKLRWCASVDMLDQEDVTDYTSDSPGQAVRALWLYVFRASKR